MIMNPKGSSFVPAQKTSLDGVVVAVNRNGNVLGIGKCDVQCEAAGRSSASEELPSVARRPKV